MKKKCISTILTIKNSFKAHNKWKISTIEYYTLPEAWILYNLSSVLKYLGVYFVKYIFDM